MFYLSQEMTSLVSRPSAYIACVMFVDKRFEENSKTYEKNNYNYKI